MNIESARKFIYLNARPLDFARWRFLFENGSRENVLDILSEYQNEDGGFGGGLEPDCLNPNSSPVQTWVATEIIEETGLNDEGHPIVKGILKYLGSGADFDGHMWLNTVPTNNDYPHAPWWNYDPEQELSYNPTACFAGFIIKYADCNSDLYALAVRLAKEAYAFLKSNYPLESMHTVSCFVELFEYLRECGQSAGIDMDEFEKILKEQIDFVLTKDTSLWSSEYVCKPSLFINSKESVFYSGNKEICDFEREFISKTQEADGSWNITWEWESYPEQWHISKNQWKSDLIIKNVKFYNAMK